MKAPITQAQAWAMIAESAGWNAKELPVLPEPNVPEGDWFILDCYIKEYAQAYGAACAAHAREMALEEAKLIARNTCNEKTTPFADGFNRAALNIELEIHALKGK